MSLKFKVLEIAFAQTNLLRDLGDGFVLRYTTGADPECWCVCSFVMSIYL
jgi:hypothetical protein